MTTPESGDDLLEPADLVAQGLAHLERSVAASESADESAALDAVHQALGVASQLQVRAPGLYPVVAAPALHRLSVLDAELDRTAEALGLSEQAIGLYRQLRAGAPAEHGDELADVLLHGAAFALAEGQHDKAADRSAEAMTLLGEIAAPDDERLTRARAIAEQAQEHLES